MKIDKIMLLVLVVVGLVGQAAGLNLTQTADENTFLVDGLYYGIRSLDIDEMGYITLILEPLELYNSSSTYPPEEDPSADPRIGPGETFLHKTPSFLVTIESGYDPEYEERKMERLAEEGEAEGEGVEDT